MTAVCSTRNVEQARALGADHVIDYTKQDFVETERGYDLVLDCVGNRSTADSRRPLGPGGTYVAIGAPKAMLPIIARTLKMLWVSRFGGYTMTFFIAKAVQEDLDTGLAMIEAGDVTPVVERTYPLQDAAHAMAYLGEGHAQGKIVITI